MDNNTQAATGLIAGLALVYVVVILAIVAFSIWLYWRIFAKAGYNGALSLLNLVPGVGPLICVVILAFGRWPIEDQLATLQAGGSFPSSPPPPPGTAVMPTP
jgi:hypothetical protein